MTGSEADGSEAARRSPADPSPAGGIADLMAPPIGPLPRRPSGVSWSEPISASARHFLVAASAVAAGWLFAFSNPAPSPGWAVVAAAATLVLAFVGLVMTGNRRRDKGYRLSARRPGRAVAAVAVIVAATAVACLTRAPMWLRFYQARPAMLGLAAQAEHGGGGHRALAGTYYLEDFGLQDYRYGDADDPGAGLGHPG